MPVELSPPEVALHKHLFTHFDAIGADVRRCDDDVVSEDFALFAHCFHPDDPETPVAVPLDQRLDWRVAQASCILNFGQVQAGRCPECGTILYTLL
ncbi:MAG: hypothetical protein H7338_23775 [Candidatus Sericytochromatia bacterium]|nr:hypothetical protein [Candidatus Sericytochromatia bacterium]